MESASGLLAPCRHAFAAARPFEEVRGYRYRYAILTVVGISLARQPLIPGPKFRGSHARLQAMWWLIALFGMTVALHVPATTWRSAAWVLLGIALVVQILMILLAGTSLVPRINGAHNWIALHPRIRIQPSEFYKITSLIVAARLPTEPADPRRPVGWRQLVIAGAPAVLILREDLGSALTFGPMLLGMLLLAGMHIRHLVMMFIAGLLVVAAGIAQLSPQGYQMRRIKAWLDPSSYAPTEGYHTERALRSLAAAVGLVRAMAGVISTSWVGCRNSTPT